MKKRIFIHPLLLLTLFLFSSARLPAQNNTDVMMQGFNWESHNYNWYNIVQGNAAAIGNAGIDMVWMPPPSDAAAPQGYLPRELYDVSTNYGSQAQLTSCINALHNNGVKALADIVINHRVGTTNWADFTNPTWGCWAVTSNDEWGYNGGNPCGAYDTGENYSAARDIDHTNQTVRNDISAWMNWLKSTIGFDGWRYDYVRGFNGYYAGVYNDATSPYFSVGELWDNLDLNNVNPHRQQIIDWIDDTQGKSHAFDFTTKGVLQQAVNGELWRLNINGGAPGVIGWYPSRAVTFLDNHDTGSTQGYWPFPGGKVMQGYAYILTHPGVPCVFWDHFFDWGLQSEISTLIDIRKRNGLHSTSTLSIQVAQGNLYAAEIDGKVAMKIGSGNWSPSGSGWALAASGSDYAVWEKESSNCNGGLTVHFKKPGNWSNATIYFWNPTPAGASTTWPGEQMQDDGNGWYSFTIPCANCANIIFSNNGASQTANLYRCDEGWYKDGSWSSSNPEGGSSDLTVHFQPTSYSNPEIYFWNVTPSGQSTTWPGVGMQSEGNGWYKYTFAGASCANFIFSNNGGSQSPDLNSCSEVWYTEGNWGSKMGAAPDELGQTLTVKAFPVPANELVRFHVSGLGDAPARIDIYDMNGRLMATQQAAEQMRVLTDGFAEGMYFYRLVSEGHATSGKFQVQH